MFLFQLLVVTCRSVCEIMFMVLLCICLDMVHDTMLRRSFVDCYQSKLSFFVGDRPIVVIFSLTFSVYAIGNWMNYLDDRNFRKNR